MKKIIIVVLILLCCIGYAVVAVKDITSSQNDEQSNETENGSIRRPALVENDVYTEIPEITLTRGENEEAEFTIKTKNDTEWYKDYVIYATEYEGDVPIENITVYINGNDIGQLWKRGSKDKTGLEVWGGCFTIEPNTLESKIIFRLSKDSTEGTIAKFKVEYNANGNFEVRNENDIEE